MAEIVKLGKLEIDLNELSNFIVEAKKTCYAGNGKKEILSDNSKLLTFQKGNLHYSDNYSGWYQAPGIEIVRWQKPNGQRIWQMAYSGGMLPEFVGDRMLTRQTFNFLKEALLTITPEHPFRGKENVLFEKNAKTNIFSYQTITKGDTTNFHGEETICATKQDGVIFRQRYIGCLVIPK